MTQDDVCWHILTHFWNVLIRFDTFWHVPKTTRHALRGAVVAPLRAKAAITTHVQNATRHEMTRSDTKSHESHEIKQKKKLRHPFWQVKYIKPEKKTGPQPKKQQTGFLRPQNLRGAATALVLRGAATAPFGSSWYIYI